MPHAVAPLPSDASIMQGVPPMLSRPVVLRVARPRCSVGSVMAMRRGALSSSPPPGPRGAFGRPGGKVRRRIEPRPAPPPPPSQTNAPVGPTCPLSLPPTEPSGARTEVLESSVRPADERRGAVGQGWAGTPRAAATAMFRDYLRRHPLASALAADCVAAGRCLSSLRWHPVRPPSSPCRLSLICY